MRLTKTCTAIDRISVIWKPDLTDKINRSFFQAAVESILLYGCTTWMLTKPSDKKITQESSEKYWINSGGSNRQTSSCTATIQVRWTRRHTAAEVRTISKETYSGGPHHMDEKKQDDHGGPIYNSSVLIQYVALKTYRARWTMETCGDRGSERSELAMQHDDDNGDILIYWPVGWGCRIHQLHLFGEVRPLPPDECPKYDNKQSEYEVPGILELKNVEHHCIAISDSSTLAQALWVKYN